MSQEILIPDGEYDIDVSALRNPGQNQFLQLKFTQYPESLASNATAHLYQKREDKAHYVFNVNGKESVSETTILPPKESEYALSFDRETGTMKLCALNTVMRVNKPKSSKKTLVALNELKQYYGDEPVAVPVEETGKRGRKSLGTSSSAGASASGGASGSSGSSTGQREKTRNKWQDFETRKTRGGSGMGTGVGLGVGVSNDTFARTPRQDQTEKVEEEEYNFDDFDQFNDALSESVKKPNFADDEDLDLDFDTAINQELSEDEDEEKQVREKKTKTKKTSETTESKENKQSGGGMTVQTLHVPANKISPSISTPGKSHFEENNEVDEDELMDLDELDNELENELDDELEEALNDDDDAFSGFEIEDDEDTSNNNNSNASTEKSLGGSGAKPKPMSLRGLYSGSKDDEEVSSEEE